MLRIRSVAGLIIMLLLLLGAIPASAQSAGTILGVVKDASGAVVSEATVTITNTETGLSRMVPSGADGAFRAPALPVGHYDLRIEKTGFSTEVQRGLILEVDQELVVNASLQVGATTQEVTVSGEAPLVNTTSSALGSMVNEQKISDLPLNGRNYVDLTMIQPGVTHQTIARTGGATAAGTWFSSNGAPIRSNYFTIDGASMVNAVGASTSSNGGTSLGVDGIREYKVVTGTFSAEYGMLMGSQMVLVSKNGTNQWHGGVFEYLRNSALDARNFFDYTSPRRLPEFQRNNYGGSFGGPIKKDKTFFYGVYEGLHQNLGVTVIDNVLPAACHQLVNPGTNNTTLANPTGCAPSLTSSTIVPKVVQPFIGLYPVPNLTGNQATFPSASTQREDFGQMRVDQNFSTADTLFARYTIDDEVLNNATGSQRTIATGVAFPWARTQGSSRNQFVTLSESHIFSPSLLNTARASFSRTNAQDVGVGVSSSGVNLYDPQYQLMPGQPLGMVTIGGVTALPGLGLPSVTLQNVYTLSDDLYYTRGRHALKFGTLLNNFNMYNLASKSKYGALTFNTVPLLMQGIYDQYSALTPGSVPGDRYWAYKTAGFYAQDDMRVTSRFTVNAGLRYEFMTVPNERYGRQSRFLNFADPTQTWTYGPVMRNPSLLNFSPRVGFAWDLMGNGKTAIRSGFGLYQDVATFGTAIFQDALAQPPYSTQSSVNSNPTGRLLTLPLTFGPADLGNRLQSMAYNLNQPYSLKYNFTVEQQMPFGMGLAVSYVGLRGIHLWQVKEGNPVFPQIVNGAQGWFPFLCSGVPSAVTCPGAVANPAYQRINPNYASFIDIATGGDSWYNSLQVLLNKRLSHGLELQSAYTWGKSLDDTQGQFFFADCAATGEWGGASPTNTRLDKGPSCFDLKHNWHLNLLYHVPNISSNNFVAKLVRGWWVGNIVTAQSGYPFTPQLNANRSNNGEWVGQGAIGIQDRVSLGTDNTSATFSCSGTGSAFPGAPPCSNGHVTYQFIPYDSSKVITGNPNMWFNPLMFRLAPAGFQGNAARGLLRAPGLAAWDISVNKDTSLPFLGETGKLQFRVEIFNILNHANFDALDTNTGRVFTGTLTDPAGAAAPVANVGKITATATSSRQIQLALKIVF
jgi:hypothetical protein